MRRLRHPVSLLLLMLGVILGTSGDQEDREILYIRPPPPSYPQATSNHIHQYQYSDPNYNQVRNYLYLPRLSNLI